LMGLRPVSAADGGTMRQSPYNDSGGPRDRDRRQAQARRRGMTLLVIAVIVIIVVVLAIVVPRHQGSTDSSSTTSSSSSTQTTASSTESSEGNGSTGSSSESTDTTTGEGPGTTTYTADLTGGNEVPPIDTAASGTLTLTVSADGTSVHYVFKVNSIISLTVARLHQGKSGATGPTVCDIYKGPGKDGLFTGKVAEGDIKAKNLVGPLKNMTIDDLVGMFDAGDVYLNVGSEAHPDGELRGQVQ
jgi:type II secretory pathway pseudopilin PulG